jgi:hypothetical protein
VSLWKIANGESSSELMENWTIPNAINKELSVLSPLLRRLERLSKGANMVVTSSPLDKDDAISKSEADSAEKIRNKMVSLISGMRQSEKAMVVLLGDLGRLIASVSNRRHASKQKYISKMKGE